MSKPLRNEISPETLDRDLTLPGSIRVQRSQSGIEYFAYDEVMRTAGPWEPTPEAALVSFMSKARQLYRSIGYLPVGAVTDKQRDSYVALARWFG